MKSQFDEVVTVASPSGLIEARKADTLFQSERIKLVRMSLPAGSQIAEHIAPGEIVVQCVIGCVNFESSGKRVALDSGQLIGLPAREPHAVDAAEDSVLLITIALPHPTPVATTE